MPGRSCRPAPSAPPCPPGRRACSARPGPARPRQEGPAERPADGLVSAMQKVQAQLDSWKTLGYSTAGVVVEIGEGVTGYRVGDRVAQLRRPGQGQPRDYVNVPANLCAAVPEGVDFQHACFLPRSARSRCSGARQADVKLGEVAAVIGLGLVGQLTVQILKAAGCRGGRHRHQCRRVPAGPAVRRGRRGRTGQGRRGGHRGRDDARLRRGQRADHRRRAHERPGGTGRQDLARPRHLVMVGVTGMDIPRDLYLPRSCILLSRSYGPGRYDALYEEGNVDYPIGYVRWTEGRNFDAFLDLIADKKLNLDLLITHRFPINDALKAFDVITGKVKERSWPSCCSTDDGAAPKRALSVNGTQPAAASGQLVLGVIGAGNYAQAMLLPHFKARRRHSEIGSHLQRRHRTEGGGTGRVCHRGVGPQGDPERQGDQRGIDRHPSPPPRPAGYRSVESRQSRLRGKTASNEPRRIDRGSKGHARNEGESPRRLQPPSPPRPWPPATS